MFIDIHTTQRNLTQHNSTQRNPHNPNRMAFNTTPTPTPTLTMQHPNYLSTPTFNMTSFCGNTESFTPWDHSDLNFGLCFQKAALAVPAYSLLAVVSAYYSGQQSEWVVRRWRQRAVISARMWAAGVAALLAVLEPVLLYSVGRAELYWVDGLVAGVQLLTWLVHLSYLASLKTRLSLGTRGPPVVMLAWVPTFLSAVNMARTAWYCPEESGGLKGAAMDVWRATALTLMGVQVVYLVTLFPQGSVGVSQYQELHREASETTPLMETSYHDYSGFHEAADPHHLGIAEEQVNVFSWLTLHWANHLMTKGSRGLLRTVDDLHDLPLALRTDVVAQQVQWAMLSTQPLEVDDLTTTTTTFTTTTTTTTPPPSPLPSFLHILHRVLGVQFYALGLLRLAGDGLGYAGPLLLHQLVTFVEQKEAEVVWGWVYAGSLVGASLIATFCSIHFNYQIAKVNLKVRAAVISTIYRKVLQVSTASLGVLSTGEIVNLMSTDTDRIVNFVQSFHALWSLPLQLTVTLYLLYRQIGIAFLAGVAVTVVVVPVNKWLANRIGILSVEMMSYKDRRVGLMSEVLTMIRMVKFNAWEATFKSRINDERFGEIKALAGRKYLDAACVFFWATTPVLIPIVTFTTYTLLGNSLEAASVFTAVALFNMLIMPLNAFPWVLNGIVEAWVSLKRVQRLMQLPDLNFTDYYTRVAEMEDKEADIQIIIANGSFSWNGSGRSRGKEGEQQGAKEEVEEEGEEEEEWVVGSGAGVRKSGRRRRRRRRKRGEEEKKEEEVEQRRGFPSEVGNGLCGTSPSLQNIDLQVLKGQVVAVVGRVGSGKSSLLSAVCAEMNKCGGAVAVAGLENGFGLATQRPWIQHASIKDNILFGCSLDITRYREVLSACALDDDLLNLPQRDNTLCGENGSALSGGQKARVALARAVYQNKWMYVLDDVFTSVDPPVALHLMRHCVHNLLAGRTVLLTSPVLPLLARVDWVLRMAGGRVVMQGPPREVLQGELTPEELAAAWWGDGRDRGVGGVPKRRLSHLDPFDVVAENGGAGGGRPVSSPSPSYLTPVMEAEEQEEGEISGAIFTTYLSAVGPLLVGLIALSLTLMQASRNLSDLWLAYWVTQNLPANSTGSKLFLDEPPAPWLAPGTPTHPSSSPATGMGGAAHWMAPSTSPLHQFLAVREVGAAAESKGKSALNPTDFYLTVYGVLAAANTLFTLMRAFLFAYGGVTAARTLHKRLLDSVLYAKITFFDNNPLGRTLNRFSSDLYSLDDSLPFQLNIFLAQVFGLAGTIAVTIYGMPWITLMQIPLAFVYYNLQRYYRHTSRDLKRIYAVSLSPLYAHFTETLQGLAVIRAMRAGHRFITRADSLLEVSQRAQFDIQVAAQWLNMRLQLIGLTMLAGVSALALLQHHFDAIEPGLVGLVISYALTVTTFLNSVVTSLTETEQEMVSVERIHGYLQGAAEGERREGVLLPPFGWISHGTIRFTNVYLRYQDHNPYALRRVNFEVGAAEKVGIVGRTGAGKSSVFVALFRLVELTRGAIYVDEVEVSQLGLKKLRSSMAIVTQDPFLFSGTVRENLDPCGECVDSQVWQAAEACHLLPLVHSLGGLEGQLHEAGRSMSAGERQLFCLARALLCRTKIVCIDEGTSKLDPETDEHIQQVIRSVFRNKTVLIIAHRVQSVRDCDRVLVLSEGEVVESGSPWELLSDRDSHFHSIFQSQ
ncbi:ATP-binding cassette sub-family C member 10-like [Eriocheir sinensis]|uniref:ATP-binding cassette sub-family C member 10-like n=1 Tax=Eriocheir sinensis TaxID=95602 RepID=UPI0021C72CCC|nr:ATP-binding cassette sub-family C member 10-like [Eriocheir sinensis]XP_050731825.1 ATP-binding cassette sub-family C member 10-like [Eriocheir sinensis]XP_050731826.1 ATP-binding cassette sub-family C member 10-like [Eriocheir sinensis]XP_050731827.1 ATP-binding cassette sub-family C member 10-like [Eriocheir sinensis]